LSSSSSSIQSSVFAPLDALMRTWWLNADEYRDRILADLVTGVLYYSSVAGTRGDRGCCYVGLVGVEYLGVNAILQMLASCVHPCFYDGIRDGQSELYEVLSRLLVPSTRPAPSFELIRAAQSFFLENRDHLLGAVLLSVWRKVRFLVGLCGPRVQSLFSSRLVSGCCSVSFVHEGGLSRVRVGSGDGWANSEWRELTCSCGIVGRFAIEEPAECLLVECEGDMFTAPLVLDEQHLAYGDLRRRLLYDLKATIVRTATGRYVCCANRTSCLPSECVWWQFDDDVVEMIGADEVSSATGVVLMLYVLRDRPSADDARRVCMNVVDAHWHPL
jgi:hypothetical protein